MGSQPTVGISANVADGNPGYCTSPAVSGSVGGAATCLRYMEIICDS